jgi:hypothetical protein
MSPVRSFSAHIAKPQRQTVIPVCMAPTPGTQPTPAAHAQNPPKR